jgi:hypothetical protein
MDVRTSSKRTLLQTQRGFGITSVALGLVVAAIMAAGAVTLYGSIMTSATIDKIHRDFEFLHQTIEKLWANTPGYDGLSEASLAASGALPEAMVSGSSILIGGQINVSLGAKTSVTCPSNRVGCRDYYIIGFYQVKVDECKMLVSKSPPGDTKRAAVGYPVQSFTGPFDREAMRAACNNVRPNGLTDVRWVYGLDPAVL